MILSIGLPFVRFGVKIRRGEAGRTEKGRQRGFRRKFRFSSKVAYFLDEFSSNLFKFYWKPELLRRVIS